MTQTAAMPGLTLRHLAKTQEGQQLINQQIPFIIGGHVYQGYKGILAETQPWQLSEAEWENIIDVDGSRPKIEKFLSDRRTAREMMKEKELEERRQKKRAALRDEYEVRKLAAEFGDELPADILKDKEPEIDPAEFEAMKDMLLKLRAELDKREGGNHSPQPEPPQAEVPTETLVNLAYACPDCSKRPPEGHEKPQQWLKGHAMQCKVAKDRRAKEAS
jgi:hypothetical protein